MRRTEADASLLRSLPTNEAAFVEPTECLSVSKLPESSLWLWEILCGPPHEISLWRLRLCGAGDAGPLGRRTEPPLMPHNSHRGFRSAEVRYPVIGKPCSIEFSPVGPFAIGGC